jgi:hypothetical protein
MSPSPPASDKMGVTLHESEPAGTRIAAPRRLDLYEGAVRIRWPRSRRVGFVVNSEPGRLQKRRYGGLRDFDPPRLPW